MMKTLCAFLFCASLAHAQVSKSDTRGPQRDITQGGIRDPQRVTVDPSGACTRASLMRYNTQNGKLWGCYGGTWTEVGGASGSQPTPSSVTINGTTCPLGGSCTVASPPPALNCGPGSICPTTTVAPQIVQETYHGDSTFTQLSDGTGTLGNPAFFDHTGNLTDGVPSIVTSLSFIIDNDGVAITTGIKGDMSVPFACTINSVTLLADQSGSIVIDLWKDTYANYPPTVADTITAAAKPTITTAVKSQDTTLTGWTKTVAAGDILRYNVDSASTITRVTGILKCTRI